ncbi:hypothetical protein HBB16_01920 [Pseudonocardia sp. MCCB 268]|nr:hypothetical protein [Pseudonocardia cytotoxica]
MPTVRHRAGHPVPEHRATVTPAGIGQWVAADHAPGPGRGRPDLATGHRDDRPVWTPSCSAMLSGRAGLRSGVAARRRPCARAPRRTLRPHPADPRGGGRPPLGPPPLWACTTPRSGQARGRSRELGYDPRTITGRIRYCGIAELYRRLTDPRVLP